MPQTFIAVQCYHCSTFQVETIKKSNKWNCKICHEKQSVRKIWSKSNKAKDIRPVVQELNMKRGEIQEQVQEEAKTQHEQFKTIKEEHNKIISNNNDQEVKMSSKWHRFIPEQKQEVEVEDSELDHIYTTHVPDKGKRGKKRKIGNPNDKHNNDQPKKPRIESNIVESSAPEPKPVSTPSAFSSPRNDQPGKTQSSKEEQNNNNQDDNLVSIDSSELSNSNKGKNLTAFAQTMSLRSATTSNSNGNLNKPFSDDSNSSTQQNTPPQITQNSSSTKKKKSKWDKFT